MTAKAHGLRARKGCPQWESGGGQKLRGQHSSSSAGGVLLFPTTASRWELKRWSFSFSRWVSRPHTQWCHPPLPRTCSIALAGLSAKVLAKGRTGIQAEEQGRAGHLPGGQPGTAHSPGLGGDWGPELGIGPKQQQALKRPQDTRPQELQGGLHETASMSKPVGGRAHAHTCS